MKTEQLYNIAEKNNIIVLSTRCPINGSCSVKTNNQYWIGIDENLTGYYEKIHLAHEVGHCVTGSMYNMYAPLDNRQKHELRADKWAILKLTPFHKLKSFIAKGIQSNVELAECFEVTEDFMKKAITYYFDQGALPISEV